MSAVTGPLSDDCAGTLFEFFASCTGELSHGERVATARTRATILIGLLFPFSGRTRRNFVGILVYWERIFKQMQRAKIGQIVQAFGRFPSLQRVSRESQK